MKSILILVLLLQSIPHPSCAQSAGDYRSKQNGAWNLASSWQTYNGSSWINASVAPSSSDGIVTILSGHTINSVTTITADQLVINSGGTLSVDGGIFTVNDGAGIDINCNGTFALTGGTLNGAGAIVFNSGSTFTWSGGTNGGSSIVTINSGATLNMNGNDVIISGTKTINNFGTWTWTSGNLSYDAASPVINNYNVLNIYTDADVVSLNGSTGSFNNKPDGIINKIGSPDDETSFSGTISFSNDGTLNVNSSKLKLNSNSINTGTINIAFGASMNFSAGTATFNTGSILSGAGNLNFENGLAAINAALITAGTINLSGGILNGNSNITLGTGINFNWSGGTIGGTGILTLDPGATFTMNGDNLNLADSKTINNYGISNWLNGTFNFNGGLPVVNNYGVFNISTDADQTGDGTFDNKPAGIINKDGSPNDETSFSGMSFLNEGVVNVRSSKLKAYISTVNTGSFNITFGANMNFTGAITFNTGSVFTGAGALTFDGGAAMINDASFSVATINMSGALVTLTPNLVLNNGYALNLSSGELMGAGNISFNNGSTFNWSGGINGGSGVMNINSGAAFNMTGNLHSLSDTRTINNYSTWSWNGGSIYLSNGSPVVNNYGMLAVNTDDDITGFNINGDAFNNMPSGIITKDGSATESTVAMDITALNNSGTIHIISGNLELNTGGTHNGNYEIDFGGQLIGSLSMPFTGSSFINNGTVDLANLNFNGSLIQTLNGEGFITRTTITNTTGIHLTGIQTITTSIIFIPLGKLIVINHLIIL